MRSWIVPAAFIGLLLAGCGPQTPEQARIDNIQQAAEVEADAIKSAGLKLYVWTVNDLGVARRMIGLGVDGITTDRPGWLRENLKK